MFEPPGLVCYLRIPFRTSLFPYGYACSKEPAGFPDDLMMISDNPAVRQLTIIVHLPERERVFEAEVPKQP